MRRRYVMLAAVLGLALLMFGGCAGKRFEEDTYYVSLWNGRTYMYCFEKDGDYTTADGDSGTYEKTAKTVVVSSAIGSVMEYTIYQEKYLLYESYEGTIPEGECFAAEVAIVRNTHTKRLAFSEDGSVLLTIAFTGFVTTDTEGTYTRSGEIIRCDFGSSGVFEYVVCDGVLWDAYGKDENGAADYEAMTASATPTASSTPTGTKTPTETPTEEESGE